MAEGGILCMERKPGLLERKEIRVSETPKLKDSLIATGFPYHDRTRSRDLWNTIDYFFLNTHGVRRLGSAATDLAYVACGRFDGFYEYNLSPWDVAAGALIVKQAGGAVTDLQEVIIIFSEGNCCCK